MTMDESFIDGSMSEQIGFQPKSIVITNTENLAAWARVGDAPGLELLRQPAYSIGSESHPDGCSPCAWFWKPQGCQNAADCRRCHKCVDGELKNRRKAKITHLKTGKSPMSSME